MTNTLLRVQVSGLYFHLFYTAISNMQCRGVGKWQVEQIELGLPLELRGQEQGAERPAGQQGARAPGNS
eukprot:scaffold254959_cov27-Tisochrysis_lutea.AAC.1